MPKRWMARASPGCENRRHGSAQQSPAAWMRAGLNRAGVDGNDLIYSGDSGVLDFLGQPLAELGAQKQVVTVRLDPAALAARRERSWMDADDFTLTS